MTIKKSINVITDMLNDAKQREVILDQDVIDLAENEKERLQTERNMRNETDNLQVNDAKPEQVKKLEEVIELAKVKGIA